MNALEAYEEYKNYDLRVESEKWELSGFNLIGLIESRSHFRYQFIRNSNGKK